MYLLTGADLCVGAILGNYAGIRVYPVVLEHLTYSSLSRVQLVSARVTGCQSDQAAGPKGAGRHLGALDALYEAVPNAMVVQMLRDPVTVTDSLNSLTYTVHSTVTEQLDIPRMARTNLEGVERMVKHGLSSDASGSDLRYLLLLPYQGGVEGNLNVVGDDIVLPSGLTCIAEKPFSYRSLVRR